jgi:hypothetical protein
MKNFVSYLLGAAASVILLASSASAQTRVSSLTLTSSNGSITLTSPSTPGSGTRTFGFPSSASSGASIILSESTGGQTIEGPLTLDGDLTFGNSATLTFGGSTGNAGDVLTSDGLGGYSWEAPSGGGGGGVPTTRTITTTSPLTIGGGSSADLSANRTIAFDFSIPNNWTGVQTLPASASQGNALVTSINAGSTAIGVAQGGTGQTSYTDGELLIGNTSGNTLSKTTLTAGSGITVTNGNGSITVAAQPQVFVGRTSSTMGSSNNTFYHPGSVTTGSNITSSLALSRMRMARAGTIQNVYIELSAAPGTSKTRVFRINNLTANNYFEITMTGTGTTANSGSNTLDVSAGDFIEIRQSPSSTPVDASAAWTFELR